MGTCPVPALGHSLVPGLALGHWHLQIVTELFELCLSFGLVKKYQFPKRVPCSETGRPRLAQCQFEDVSAPRPKLGQCQNEVHHVQFYKKKSINPSFYNSALCTKNQEHKNIQRCMLLTLAAKVSLGNMITCCFVFIFQLHHVEVIQETGDISTPQWMSIHHHQCALTKTILIRIEMCGIQKTDISFFSAIIWLYILTFPLLSHITVHTMWEISSPMMTLSLFQHFHVANDYNKEGVTRAFFIIFFKQYVANIFIFFQCRVYLHPC